MPKTNPATLNLSNTTDEDLRAIVANILNTGDGERNDRIVCDVCDIRGRSHAKAHAIFKEWKMVRITGNGSVVWKSSTAVTFERIREGMEREFRALTTVLRLNGGTAEKAKMEAFSKKTEDLNNRRALIIEGDYAKIGGETILRNIKSGDMVTTRDAREWLKENGYEVKMTGRISKANIEAFNKATGALIVPKTRRKCSGAKCEYLLGETPKIRRWAKLVGLPVGERGSLSREVMRKYREAMTDGAVSGMIPRDLVATRTDAAERFIAATA